MRKDFLHQLLANRRRSLLAVDRPWRADGKLDADGKVAAHFRSDSACNRRAAVRKRAPLAPAIAMARNEIDAIGVHVEPR
jgi:hypothetical protein